MLNKNDRKKLAKEMACDCYDIQYMLKFNDPYMLSKSGWYNLTDELIKLGWVKSTVDSVVISIEEYKKLKKALNDCVILSALLERILEIDIDK